MATVSDGAIQQKLVNERVGDAETDNGDAYDELEDWYSASFPRIHSSPSFAHMGGAFIKPTSDDTSYGTSDPVSVKSLDHTAPTVQPVHALWESASQDHGDYEIDLDEVQSTRSAPHSTEDTRPVEHDSTPGSLVDPDENDPSLLAFLPKTFFTRRAPAESPSSRCCSHCGSDVNGKLLVKCATCSFRRHLYCFSPPLKQHPALTSLVAVPRHRRLPIPKLIAQWRCESCVHRLGPPSPEQSPPKPRRKSPPPPRLPKPQQQQEQQQYQPSHSTAPQSFDWHAFRKAKLAALDSRDEDTDTALVLYSPSELLLRRTALFWRQHVERRRKLRKLHTDQATKCLVPVKRPGLHVALTPREAADVALTKQQNQQSDEEQHRTLFDDALYYPFDDPRPIFQTLRRRLPRAVSVTLSDEELERLATEAYTREQEETQIMEREDEDAPTPEQAARAAYRRAALAAAERGDPSLLGLYLAAQIIDRVAVKWLQRVRSQIQVKEHAQESIERELMQKEELSQRRSRAQRQVATLRCTIRFLLAMWRSLRRAQVKKELLLSLQEATEDSRVPEENRREQLAQRRIQRFFLRRVRKYIQVKKKVMAWRVARWWKHRHYAAVFRCLAIAARIHRREASARCIQRNYRKYRVYTTFKRLREQQLIRRLRRVLQRWLMQRMIRKEATRVAVFQAAVAITAAGVIVDPGAQLYEVLRALGIALYERSDFWNAASLLERAYRIHSGGWDAAALLALAYSHHMAWYSSYDVVNLTQADTIYCGLLDGQAADVFVLQELAMVRLESQDFGGALILLARVIELFRDEDGFPLWLLLAGVVLQQVGQWAQSVEYLTYLVDMALPDPYVERDVLALCAIGYEHVSGTASREAWRAAIRLWTLEKKLANVQGQYTSAPHDSTQKDPTARLSAQRKWELLLDLAQRAFGMGHYIVVCRALLYAVERLPSRGGGGGEGTAEEQRTWWYLGESFRHLGRLDLYVEATARSRPQCTEADRKQWEKEAAEQATAFATELKVLRVKELVERIHSQYAGAASVTQSEWIVEDVETNY